MSAQAPPVPNVWDTADVAEYFKVSPRSIRDWRNEDPTFPLPLDLPGRTVRFSAKAVIEWAHSEREAA